MPCRERTRLSTPARGIVLPTSGTSCSAVRVNTAWARSTRAGPRTSSRSSRERLRDWLQRSGLRRPGRPAADDCRRARRRRGRTIGVDGARWIVSAGPGLVPVCAVGPGSGGRRVSPMGAQPCRQHIVRDRARRTRSARRGPPVLWFHRAPRHPRSGVRPVDPPPPVASG
jgi:hypothetical protein